MAGRDAARFETSTVNHTHAKIEAHTRIEAVAPELLEMLMP